MAFQDYQHKDIEKKWQERWEQAKLFEAKDDSKNEKFYVLVEFPYPSGEGLHVGHPRPYTALDVVARKKRMEGKNVLFPMGWDAFGLPAENYALKTGIHPSVETKKNIDTFRRQLKSLGFSFDWSREVDTTDPAYYKWTQWMFLEFFKAGLAYKAKTMINWCPKDKTGLANEEVVNGCCERCGTPTEKREKEQWMIAITKYADRLIDDLKTVDYLPKIKKQQEDWIGRSEGAEIDFAVEGSKEKITVFTTRPDTLDGVTYVVLAPEHPLVDQLTVDSCRKAVQDYLSETKKKTDADRGDETKKKTGVNTGGFAINPLNGEKVPVWVADYVLGSYGTGAVMAVPKHDERDAEFAEVYQLPVLDRPLIPFDEAVKRAHGKKTIKFKLRDWVFSRQRYWGEPIPLVRCESGCAPEAGGWVPVDFKDLPVKLPEVQKYEPTDTGESPLAAIKSFVETTCPQCGGKAKRETDTMPNWAGSSWYFLRYIDPKNSSAFADAKKLQHWMPVDLYNGGMEHTTLHLLYSRFWNKFLFDRGFVPCSEPYARRHSHGLIMAEDGTKMSKSKGNVVNPDDIVNEFGADTLRMYLLFMGPFEEPVPWSTNGVVGVRRFLEKVKRYVENWTQENNKSKNQENNNAAAKLIEKTIKKIGDDIEGFRFNTAVSSLMILFNELPKLGAPTQAQLERVLIVLAPFAPHLASEMYELIGGKGFVEQLNWPSLDESLLKDEVSQVVVQINGKLRDQIVVRTGANQDEAMKLVEASEKLKPFITGKKIVKIVYVPGKILNLVIPE